MKKIAIIPARAGSKRIPNKNIKDFFGHPIIAYSIKAAINSGLYDEVMVSTDSETIRQTAIQYGAQVPFLRSEDNSTDLASTVDVLLEVLERYKADGNNFNVATCIYPCAPFITKQILSNSIVILNEGYDCVFPVLEYTHPIQRALKMQKGGRIIPFDESYSNQRTQDLDKAFYDAGMFYTFDVLKFFLNKNLRTNNTFGVLINELHAQDIDSENDWLIAELKYKLFSNYGI